VSRFAGIHDLAYCFARVQGGGSAAYNKDWVGVGANVLGLAGKAIWYAKGQNEALKKALETVGKKILPTPTAIVDVTMVVVVIIDLFNGFGPPLQGDLSTAREQLENARDKLKDAVPDNDLWSGDAAQEYTAQVVALTALVETMMELDKQLQSLVKNQADKIQETHNALAILGFALVCAQGVALCMYLIPFVGPEISFLFQVATALAAAVTVVTFETLALANSSNVGAEVNGVSLGYGEVAKTATQGGVFEVIKIAGAEESNISSFTEISGSMSGPSAVSRMPTVASLMNLAGENTSEEVLDTLSAFTSDDEMPGEGTPEVPETPQTPTTPPFKMPTMTELTAFSKQGAQFSKHISQHMNLVNQTMGSVQQSVQQMASQGQQGQGAAALADEAAQKAPPEETAVTEARPEEAALAGAEGAGATSGSATGERAPVDAAGAEQAEKPSPVERIV
jgi:EspA/EspE family